MGGAFEIKKVSAALFNVQHIQIFFDVSIDLLHPVTGARSKPWRESWSGSLGAGWLLEAPGVPAVVPTFVEITNKYESTYTS